MPPRNPTSARTTARGDVRAAIAAAALTRETGQRMPTVQELQEQTRTGAGTVVKAIRELESHGALSLSSHGHLGTLIVERDVGALWNAAGYGNFRVEFPPPGPVEQRGLLEVEFALDTNECGLATPLTRMLHPGF